MYKPSGRNFETLRKIQELTLSLANPLEEASWNLKLNPDLVSGYSLITYELQMCAFKFFLSRGEVGAGAFSLFCDFCWFFHIEVGDLLDQDHSVESRRSEFWKHLSNRKEELLAGDDLKRIRSVSDLAVFDSRAGTDFANTARRLFYEFIETLSGLNYKGKRGKPELDDLHRYVFGISKTLPQSGGSIGLTRVSSNTSYGDRGESLNDLIAELSLLIGLDRVKADVSELVNFIKVQQLRKERGLSSAEISRHLVFIGNPGTGKTTVARLLSRVFRHLGLLSNGHLVETDRTGLVAGYVGQTAIKTAEVLTKARGGVLFIDEAYTLSHGGESDFGQEAIDILLKSMEDNREDLIVILAGYPERMRQFLSSNPGINSRFGKVIEFEDYRPEQLVRIFESICLQNDFQADESAIAKLRTRLRSEFETRTETFGNARLVRNIFESAIAKHANRVASLSHPDDFELSLLVASDIPER